ncbi:MAG TPA: hypothetical protein VMX54_15130 [Vicinamibacteria bacterium]|nr:hypothetical protein [Vicinamibacteria bacterium]
MADVVMPEGAAPIAAVGPTTRPPAAPEVASAWADRRRLADRVFRGALAATGLLTLVWLFFVVSGRDGGALFHGYQVTTEAVGRVAVGFVVGTVLWGWLWYGVKRLLLRKLAGLSGDECSRVFRSRLHEPFDLRGLLAGRSERRVRIADMVGRRGRFLILGLAGFSYVATHVAASPRPDFLVAGFGENLLDGLVGLWVMLALYHSDGFLGRVAYGAQTRIMDGALGRANCLVIFSLWAFFKFAMVALGTVLAGRFPAGTYTAVYAFIWLSYLCGDGLSEIVGSLFGKQKLRVWGLGEVNRKSWAGTWACFLGSLGVCVGFMLACRLPLPWLGLALAVSLSNTVLELFSPRGTDDITMATGNALLCWAFATVAY